MTNTYLDKIAVDIWRTAEPDAVMEEADMLLYRVYAVLLLAKGRGVTPEDVHNAWAVWASEHEPNSSDLVPFTSLSPNVQRKDQLYVDTIHLVSERIHL